MLLFLNKNNCAVVCQEICSGHTEINASWVLDFRGSNAASFLPHDTHFYFGINNSIVKLQTGDLNIDLGLHR